MTGRRSALMLRILVVVAAVETVLAAVRRVDDARHFVAGDRSWEAVSGLVALCWLPIMVTVLSLTVWQLGWFRRRQNLHAQSMAAAAATTHEWVWEATPDLVVTYSNDRVRDLLGVGPEAVVGRHLTELMMQPGSTWVSEDMQARVLSGEGWRDLENEWRHADGHGVVLEGSASVMLDERGRVEGVRGARRRPPGTAAEHRARSVVRRRVESVLDEEALEIALQPIRDLGTGTLVGCEALARFDSATPDVMFEQAEAVGLGVDLELLAVRRALPLIGDLRDPVYLSINASPNLVRTGSLTRLLTQPGTRLDRLVLEITERAQVDEYEDLDTVLAPLRAAGMRLAVDDTGAGYASFHHVLRLRPDIIKLDRSLISAIDTDPAQRSLVTAVALLALDLDATLTAEGVERESQVAALTDLGIRHGQGYLLGHPRLGSAAVTTADPYG